MTSPGEQAFLTENLWSGNYFFIGGLQVTGSDEPEMGWMWVTGEAWDYTAWENGEPNNAGGAEDRVQWFSSPKGWNDVRGTLPYQGYIVEYETVPEPSSLALFAIAGLLFVAYVRVRPVHGRPR